MTIGDTIADGQIDARRGTGLGLYISRALVRGPGGDITVESALRRGSCFRFSDPVNVVEAQQTTVATTSSTDVDEVLKVLIIDDNDLVLNANQILVQTIG